MALGLQMGLAGGYGGLQWPGATIPDLAAKDIATATEASAYPTESNDFTVVCRFVHDGTAAYRAIYSQGQVDSSAPEVASGFYVRIDNTHKPVIVVRIGGVYYSLPETVALDAGTDYVRAFRKTGTTLEILDEDLSVVVSTTLVGSELNWSGLPTEKAYFNGMWNASAGVVSPFETGLCYETYVFTRGVDDEELAVFLAPIKARLDGRFAMIKDAGNPAISISGTETNIRWTQMIKAGAGDYDLFYYSIHTATNCLSVATSADGESFSKPSLGLVNVGGSTANNVIGDFVIPNDAIEDPDDSDYYLFLIENNATANGIYLYKAPKDYSTPLAFYKTITTTTLHGQNLEAKSLIQRNDGRWIAYYTQGHGAQRRSVGYYLSDSTDVTSTWTDMGLIPSLTAKTQERQHYGFDVTAVGGVWLGISIRYEKTTELIPYMNLLACSDEGANWHTLQERVMEIGASTAWDDSMVLSSKLLTEADGSMRLWYGGAELDHASGAEGAIGIADMSLTQKQAAIANRIVADIFTD